MTSPSDDPRARRTRAALVAGLCGTMRRESFDRISVATIADAASVNRATFYAHFPDKYALLDALVQERFDAMLESRGVVFSSCTRVRDATILAVCDFLVTQPETADGEAPHPYLETATIAVVRRRLLAGMRREDPDRRGDCRRAELIASTAAWAIYGAAREWFGTASRVPATEIVPVIRELVDPIFATARWRDTAAVG